VAGSIQHLGRERIGWNGSGVNSSSGEPRAPGKHVQQPRLARRRSRGQSRIPFGEQPLHLVAQGRHLGNPPLETREALTDERTDAAARHAAAVAVPEDRRQLFQGEADEKRPLHELHTANGIGMVASIARGRAGNRPQ
jgi:hypothetical protein